MRNGFWVLILLVILLAVPPCSNADELQDCKQEEPRRRITGCSEIINKGGQSGMRLPDAYNNRGRAYVQNGDYDRAIADLNDAIRLNPKGAAAYINRGWAYGEKRDYDRAIADFEEAIRLDPNFARAYNNRGWAYNHIREYDRAIADLNEAIRLDPKHALAYNNRGWAYIEKAEFDKAIADLNETLRLSPRFPGYNLRGWAYIEKREYDLAIADLNEAIRLNPTYASAYANRGWAHREKGDYDRAIADLDEAIRLDPKHARAHNGRGNAHRAKGDLDRAIADYNEAIRLDPKFARAYANRGMAYASQGERDRALADYRKIIELPAATPSDRQRQETARERIDRLTRELHASTRRVALVIGNANYSSVGLLTNPRNDARAVAAALRRLGFVRVTELYDLSLAAMGRALKDFGDHAAGAEWAVVFFAGHGIEVNGTNYLLPIDAELKRDTHVADEAVSLDRVQAKVDGASKLGLVILDACRNNPFLARMARTGGKRSVGRGLANTEPEGNVLVAYSAKHGTFAEDGVGKHSPFTEALLSYLEESGLEMNLLFRRVRDEVRKKTERRQDPFVYGSLSSEPLYFKSTTAR